MMMYELAYDALWLTTGIDAWKAKCGIPRRAGLHGSPLDLREIHTKQ